MITNGKYPRTYHYSFSPGTTSDDRINKDWWENMVKCKGIVDTEKLDGEGTSMNELGVFARSHAAPTRHPWSNHLKSKFSTIQADLKRDNIELFGENLYARHSILYPMIESHFYMFAVRILDTWLSWDEVKWYAEFFEYPTVPEIRIFNPNDTTKEEVKTFVIDNCSQESEFDSYENDFHLNVCTKEGMVSRNVEEYKVDDFKKNVFKYVRENHVSTDVHWSRNWKRADLKWELEARRDKKLKS